MIISAVAMSTPMPIVEMSFNRACERVNVKGREPAENELRPWSVREFILRVYWEGKQYAMAMTVLKVSSIRRPSIIAA